MIVGVDVMVGVAVGVNVMVGVNVGPPGVMVGVAVTTPPTTKHCENSDVLLFRSVAVAVMIEGAGMPTGSVTLKLPWQKASVDTVVLPTNVCPSPKSFGGAALQLPLEKNSIR